MNKEIISKVKEAVSSTTKKVVKFSGEAIDYTKLKLKIAEINSKLDEKYAAIGLAVYEGNDEAEIELLCDAISSLREELENLKLKLDDYKNKKSCPVCGFATERDNPYCPSCGNKF